MLRGRLEADGVRCTLQGDKAASVVGDVNRLNTSWSNPLGGTMLLVHESDLAEAREVLREMETVPTRTRRRATPAMRVIQIVFAVNVSSVLLFFVFTQFGALAASIVLIAILVFVWRLGT
jgi:hypothetical protein